MYMRQNVKTEWKQHVWNLHYKWLISQCVSHKQQQGEGGKKARESRKIKVLLIKYTSNI